jgi:tRNA A-37 threonylcarbamoyl transferase component Bud32
MHDTPPSMNAAQVASPVVGGVSATGRIAQPASFSGALAAGDLLPVLRLLQRTQASGLVRCEGLVDGALVKAQIHIRQGNIRAAFYGDLLGATALTRAMLMGAGSFILEAIVEQPPRNITHDTTFLLDSIAKVLAEVKRVRAESHPAPELDPEEKSASVIKTAPATERIAAFNPPQAGEVIGRCRLLKEIGHGASSVVFLAHHQALDVEVVVKVLLQEGGRSHHLALTINEAQVLARLNHPNIVRLYDFDDAARHPHLIVEYINGPSLSLLLNERSRLDVDEALPLFLQVTEALAYADATMGLVHCDLKPENILLTNALQVKLADFGLAKSRARATGVPEDVVVGTPSYIAPEQVRGGHAGVDRRSDIYALGATFFHVLTGRPPFVDEDPIRLMCLRLEMDAPRAHELLPSIDRRLSDLLAAMLARDPARRLDTYEELSESLLGLLEAGDRRDSVTTIGNIIRRRTTFWRTVPNKLFG